MATCEECGQYVKDQNLLKHYQTAHPKASTREIPVPRTPRQKVPVSSKTKKTIAAILTLIALLIVGAVFGIPIGPNLGGSDCINHSNLAYHWHATLQITVGGQLYTIPANIGISAACMRPIHSHDTSGTLHIESTDAAKRYTLGEFFSYWGRSLGNPQMTVDDQPSSQGAGLVLTDGLTISLAYESFA